MIVLAVLVMVQSPTPAAPRYKPGSPEWSANLDRILAQAKSEPTVFDVLERGLKRLHGKPQGAAFKLLGYPDRKMTVGRELVYIWENSAPVGYGQSGTLHCSVKVIVRKAVVLSTDFRGNNGACETYAIAVDPAFRPR